MFRRWLPGPFEPLPPRQDSADGDAIYVDAPSPALDSPGKVPLPQGHMLRQRGEGKQSGYPTNTKENRQPLQEQQQQQLDAKATELQKLRNSNMKHLEATRRMRERHDQENMVPSPREPIHHVQVQAQPQAHHYQQQPQPLSQAAMMRAAQERASQKHERAFPQGQSSRELQQAHAAAVAAKAESEKLGSEVAWLTKSNSEALRRAEEAEESARAFQAEVSRLQTMLAAERGHAEAKLSAAAAEVAGMKQEQGVQQARANGDLMQAQMAITTTQAEAEKLAAEVAWLSRAKAEAEECVRARDVEVTRLQNALAAERGHAEAKMSAAFAEVAGLKQEHGLQQAQYSRELQQAQSASTAAKAECEKLVAEVTWLSRVKAEALRRGDEAEETLRARDVEVSRLQNALASERSHAEARMSAAIAEVADLKQEQGWRQAQSSRELQQAQLAAGSAKAEAEQLAIEVARLTRSSSDAMQRAHEAEESTRAFEVEVARLTRANSETLRRAEEAEDATRECEVEVARLQTALTAERGHAQEQLAQLEALKASYQEPPSEDGALALEAMPVVADLMELLQEASVAMTSGKTHLPNDHASLAKDGQFVHFLTQVEDLKKQVENEKAKSKDAYQELEEYRVSSMEEIQRNREQIASSAVEVARLKAQIECMQDGDQPLLR